MQIEQMIYFLRVERDKLTSAIVALEVLLPETAAEIPPVSVATVYRKSPRGAWTEERRAAKSKQMKRYHARIRRGA